MMGMKVRKHSTGVWLFIWISCAVFAIAVYKSCENREECLEKQCDVVGPLWLHHDQICVCGDVPR